MRHTDTNDNTKLPGETKRTIGRPARHGNTIECNTEKIDETIETGFAR